VYGKIELFAQCLQSVLTYTPPEVSLLVADDGSPDLRLRSLLEELVGKGLLNRPVFLARQPANLGFVGNVNAAFAACDPADVVILNSDCVVGEGWFEGMRDAAYSDSVIATSTALTNHGSIVSVPHRNQPGALPQNWTVDQAADAVKSASLRLRPRIPTAIGHCAYIKRAALDLVGDFDVQFAPGYDEETDFSQRCLSRGMFHVAADDVLVWHQGGASFSPSQETDAIHVQHQKLIRSRYPYFERGAATAAVDDGALGRALGIARRALMGVSVTIDGACLGGALTGTQVVVLEVIHALAQSGAVHLRVAVPPRCGDAAQRILAELSDVEVIRWDLVGRNTDRTDIVHRPYQVSNRSELGTLRMLGDRLVITHHDMIAYRIPQYFPGFDQWQLYREVTRDALGAADAVVFGSHHAAADALADDLVPEDRLRVIPDGVDHHLSEVVWKPREPRGAGALAEGQFLMCLGADYGHKNRLFALRLLDELQRRHQWNGRVALVGPHVPWGSSSAAEAEYLLRNRDVARMTVRLPAVSEGEKAWLLQHAAGVLYPTVYEGFGFIPFEAATAGVPCFFAAQSSLAEVLPNSAATIEPWDVASTADRVVEVLRDPVRAEGLVAAVKSAGERYRWGDVAIKLLDVYRAAADAPPQVRVGRDWQELSISVIGRCLVGEGGALPPRVQASLWAISRRRYLRIPIFTFLQLFHRMGRLPVALKRRRSR
jgi:glycosyltransferase involved in cell wall biosynthesis/GT2 family glycosyltransferase